ncbi:Uncharacterized protein TCM_010333 [Theobroma cacao]|uniref:Uncharacterized protein n=1 Tax=Theobroma cacao TaxID=3641 RepID=A0A061E7W4_THECC|nr:Uncharacterized protein TCM_010333 [Theobroma cacao]
MRKLMLSLAGFRSAFGVMSAYRDIAAVITGPMGVPARGESIHITTSQDICAFLSRPGTPHRARDNRREASTNILHPECRSKPRKALVSAFALPRSRQPRADLIKDQCFRRNRQSDTLEKVNQILVKFECDRDKRIREKDSDRPSMQSSALMVHCR